MLKRMTQILHSDQICLHGTNRSLPLIYTAVLKKAARGLSTMCRWLQTMLLEKLFQTVGMMKIQKHRETMNQMPHTLTTSLEARAVVEVGSRLPMSMWETIPTKRWKDGDHKTRAKVEPTTIIPATTTTLKRTT